MQKCEKVNRIVFLSIVLMATLGAGANAQTNFLDGPHAYLGQTPPSETPKIFAAGILADSGIVLGRLSFSKDGKELYYGFAKHWFDNMGSGIKQIVFDGKKWNRPTVLFENLSYPTLSIDGNTLFLGGKNSTVWISEKVNNKWSSPRIFLDREYGLYNFQPTNSGVYYTGSNANQGSKKDYSTYDFCTLTVTAGDTIIKSLGSPLNTPAFDGDFYIAPDESYIIISAKETKTYECELWISFRKADKTWTSPKSLGPKINDGLAHRFGQYVSPDGKYLFYTRGAGEKDCNFYWVRFDTLLKKLQKE